MEKKKYISPDLEIVVFEVSERIMDFTASVTDPDWGSGASFAGPSAERYIQSLPKGYVDTDDE